MPLFDEHLQFGWMGGTRILFDLNADLTQLLRELRVSVGMAVGMIKNSQIVFEVPGLQTGLGCKSVVLPQAHDQAILTHFLNMEVRVY
jgi:hypothetical protein